MTHELHGETITPDNLASEDGKYTLLAATPLMQAKASTGRKKYWAAFSIEDDDGTVYTRTVSFNEKASGGLSTPLVSTPKEIKGKNIGRSNETTPAEQAASEIESNAQTKRDKKKYWVVGEKEPETLPLPMLAHSYDKRGHDIQFPCFGQPKLDGVRMLFDGSQGWSRGGKYYIPEVLAHLNVELPEGVILDGELMLDHNRYSFQETIRHVKKYRGDDAPKLQYFIYDVILTDEPDTGFVQRMRVLKKLFQEHMWQDDYIKPVSTVMVRDEEHAHELLATSIEQGYEGWMLRNGEGAYKRKHRSKDLQKLKEFDDAEFDIIDYTEGKGKDKGTVIFTCVTPEKRKPFQVRPRGSEAERAYWFEIGSDLVGESLTVRYQGVSEDGIPRFPVGINVRVPDLQG